jgi:type II secretory ATPase GspE/PulE/Tfp pilus assembly ATPase PilB-like protein
MSALVDEPAPPPVDGLRPEEAFAALLEQAAAMGASDLFFACEETQVAVLVRHLGLIRLLALLTPEQGHHCVSHVKVRAGMDIAEHRRPQDGRLVHDRPGRPRIDLRVNVLPTLYGEDCALRLLVRDPGLLDLEELGFIQAGLNDLLALLHSPSGLLLVSGPTGVGKTTTLYACLRYLHNGERKINTIEDPVEYGLEGVRQSQVNPQIGLGFPELLRAVLRQAPDVIMVGEVRDAVTAEIAVHAANSGHLVLATSHAPDAAAAVQTMRAWGVGPHFLATSLLGIVAQRLVRTLCPECKAPFPLGDAPATFAEVQPWLGPGQGLALFAAHGCPACRLTGYAGRKGVFEVLRVSPALRARIAEGRPTRALREQAVREGLIELRKAALLEVARGVTTAEEVVRAVPAESLGLDD